MLLSVRGDDCPVFGPLEDDVADDKQRSARVVLGVPDLVWGEDDLCSAGRGSLDLDVLYLVAARQQIRS